MSLRKPPARTPALLAANRANARKSTGPRTPEGKRWAASECAIKPKAYGNMITITDLDTFSPVHHPSRAAAEGKCRSPRPVQTLAELLALAPGQDRVRSAPVKEGMICFPGSVRRTLRLAVRPVPNRTA
jgi:hypothetical protein